MITEKQMLKVKHLQLECKSLNVITLKHDNINQIITEKQNVEC
jgi:hypothetical protein